MRELCNEVSFSHLQFIQPLFVSELNERAVPSPVLAGVNIDSIDSVIEQITADIAKGITKFLLFPIPDKKSEGEFDFGFVVAVIEKIKNHFKDTIWLAVDLCLCSYTQHGHCGVLNEDCSQVMNDDSVRVLAAYAKEVAEAGADCIAPSDMMDGRIAAIRSVLDQQKLDQVSILSYSAKFSSNLYGPFRDVVNSAPSKEIKIKDRKSYQISMTNPSDAIQSTLRDIEEGADMVMVKPGIAYLDIVYRLSQEVLSPIVVYQVSGEYQSIELLAQNGLINRAEGHMEMWTSMFRSGCNTIISYASRNAKEWIEARTF